MAAKYVIAITALIALTSASALAVQGDAIADNSRNPEALGLPDFLPSYYAPTLLAEGSRLLFERHQTKDGVDLYFFSSADHSSSLTIEHPPCSASVCEAIFNRSFDGANQIATKNSGEFIKIAPTEFGATWKTESVNNAVFAFRLPNSLIYWTYTTRQGSGFPVVQYFDQILSLVNRQRYEQASAAGDIEMGRWDASLLKFANQLLKDGDRPSALNVLKAIVVTSPTNYAAQAEFASLTPDAAAAQESAKVVLKNAETPELLSKSAAILKEPDPNSEQVPYLKKGESGLQIILIALPSCDIGVLEEAARIYSGITKISVKIARLQEVWQFGEPDRIPNQREIQEFIVQRGGVAVDFKGWSLSQYKNELLRVAAAADAVTRFRVISLVSTLDAKTAQYTADPYLAKLQDVLAKYRSDDPRTLFVGVTDSNISTGDANFVFGVGEEGPNGSINLVSYHMMLAKYSGALYESRPRLAERLAKELVPATLLSLGIPRPADPMDPASYASGIDRLDQKGLILSAPTRAALDKLR